MAGIALAVILVVTSYRVEANPWKTQFNSKYAQKLLRESPTSGDSIYAGNLILAQAALDSSDVANAKQYLLQAASTPGTRRIEQNGLDFSVARALFERGEKDAVLEYLKKGRTLWPQGAANLSRMEAAIRAGRRPNFNARGPGAGYGGGQGNPQDR
jgi:predicted negative regulator of RcsB-dependent stress response